MLVLLGDSKPTGSSFYPNWVRSGGWMGGGGKGVLRRLASVDPAGPSLARAP